MAFFKKIFLSFSLPLLSNGENTCSDGKNATIQEVRIEEEDINKKIMEILDVEYTKLRERNPMPKTNWNSYKDEVTREREICKHLNLDGSNSSKMGVIFYEKLYSKCANFKLRKATKSFGSALDWITQKNKSFEYFVQMPHIMMEFINDGIHEIETLEYEKYHTAVTDFLVKIADDLSFNFSPNYDFFGIFNGERYKKDGEEISDDDKLNMVVMIHAVNCFCKKAFETVYFNTVMERYIKESEATYYECFRSGYVYQIGTNMVNEIKRIYKQKPSGRLDTKDMVSAYNSMLEKTKLMNV